MALRSVRMVAFVLVACLVASCAKKKPAKAQPEETHQSMLNLSPLPAGTCPELTGTYECLAENEKETALMGVSLRNTAQGQHLRYGPEEYEKLSFVDFIIEQFALDDGGFLVNGQVQDRVAPVRKGIEYLNSVLDNSIVAQIIKLLGFDLKAALKEINPSNIKAGYVAGCQNQVLTLHYVVGNDAAKAKVSKNPDNSINLVVFAIEEGGPIRRYAETCRFAKSEVQIRKPISEMVTNVDPKDWARDIDNSYIKTFTYPGSMNVELAGSSEITYKEPVYMRFDRYGFLTSRHIYVLNNAFLGKIDDFFWDDVVLTSPWKVISLNVETKKVLAGPSVEEATEIGLVTGEPPNLKIELDSRKVEQKYDAQNLTLEAK